MLFYATKLVVVYYNNYRKLIQADTATVGEA